MRGIQHRLPREEWNRRSLASHLLDGVPLEPAAYSRWREKQAGRFFFDELPHQDLLSRVSQPKALAEAEALLRGRWTYFGMLPVDAGLPPDWHRNPLTGESAPADVHWADISDFAFGDIKLIWEASRFSPVYVLVRAYANTKDDRYPEAFWRLVEDWAERNPPQSGPNWKCGQEAAFRLMAWCFGLYGFADSSQTTPERISMLSKMIAVTAERIEANISYALSQNNNHGISEAVGLFTAGTLFSEFRRAQSWRKQGRELLERQAIRQIYEDGSYVQHSMNYHRVILHDYVWALRLAERNGEPFSSDLYARLRRSSEFLDEMTDPHTGEAPNYGNNDGTLVLPLSDCEYGDFRPTLQALHYLATQQRRFPAGNWDEMMVWLFGAESLHAPMMTGRTPSSLSIGSGYYLLRGPESWCMIRCAEYHDRPAQADQLHLDLWWKGLNVVVDSGTYLYNAPPLFDGIFARTSAHNTVTVDGRDQMLKFSRFLWLNWAQRLEVQYEHAQDQEFWHGAHSGYERQGVIHRRSVERRGDTWNIIDNIEGSGCHRASLRWLFPDFPSIDVAELGLVKLKTQVGYIVVNTTCSAYAEFSLVRAGETVVGTTHPEDITRGWVSHTYASKQPALSLGLDAEVELPIRFETTFEFVKHSSENLQSQVRFAEVGE
jgi:asparagine synthase (glutamine-hydrolysing)